MQDDEKAGEPVAAFRRYADTFAKLDPRAVVPYFHEPALFIAPQGVVSLPTGAHVEQFFGRLMQDLRAQGYARSEFSQLAEHRLGRDLAIVSGIGIWTQASGEELRRFGLTYTLCRTQAAWRIAVAAVHDPEVTLSRPDRPAPPRAS